MSGSIIRRSTTHELLLSELVAELRALKGPIDFGACVVSHEDWNSILDAAETTLNFDQGEIA